MITPFAVFGGTQLLGGGFTPFVVPQVTPQNKDWCVGPYCQP